MKSKETVKIKAKLLWPCLTRVNDQSERYQVDLTEMSDAAKDKLREMGLEIRNKEGKGDFITCKSNFPIAAYDDGGAEIDGSIVGNGTEAIVWVGYYDWKGRTGSGRSASTSRLIVTNLVEYKGKNVAIDLAADDIL